MQRGAVPIPLLAVLLLAGCGDDDGSPTRPAGGGYVLFTSATIGSEGGTLSTDDFSLTVPAGAFDVETDLHLYGSSEDDPFGDAAVTDVFRLEGVPEDFSEALKVSLRYEGTLTPDNHIAVGEEVTVPYTGQPDIDYTLIPAADSVGCLHCEIPVPAGKRTGGLLSTGSPGDLRRDLSVVGTTHFGTYYTADGKFRIEYPQYLVTEVGNLETCLSQAIVLYVSMGFDAARITTPIPVLVRKPEAGKPDLYYNGEKIVVNELKMNEAGLAEICWMAVAEVFDRFYEIYTSFSFSGGNEIPLQNRWLYYATKMVLEDHYAGEELGLAEALLTDSEYYPFVGFQAGATSSIPQTGFHGYGMGAVIRWLWVRDKEMEFIGQMYAAILSDGPTRHLAGLLSAVGDETYEWVPEFFKEYSLGGVYPVDVEKILRYSSRWDIDDASDTLKVFSYQAADLWAHPVRIVPQASVVDTATSLHLTVSGEVNPDYLWILAFSYAAGEKGSRDAGELELLAEGRELVVENLKWFTDRGKEIVAVVVNSAYEEPDYSSTWDLDLTLRAVRRMDLSIFDTAMLQVRYEALWNDGPEANQDLMFSNRDGGFTGYNYTASWDSTTGGVRRYGQFNVTLASDTRIASWSVDNHWSWDNTIYTYRCVGGEAGIPRTEVRENQITFGLYGETTCGPITEIYVQQIVEGVEQTLLLDFDCAAGSYIEFNFRDERP